MCRRVDCGTCHKPTWAGCGQHIESALAGVKPEDRCHCPRKVCNLFIIQSDSCLVL